MKAIAAPTRPTILLLDDYFAVKSNRLCWLLAFTAIEKAKTSSITQPIKTVEYAIIAFWEAEWLYLTIITIANQIIKERVPGRGII